MMRNKWILSLLLALLLTAAVLVPASALSGAPQLELTPSGAGTSQGVGLAGLPGDCQSVQITLRLSDGEETYSFTPDSSLENRDGLYVTWKQSGKSVTIYVTAKSGVLTEDGTLALGTLSAEEPFTVEKLTGWKLLNEDSMPTSSGTDDSEEEGGTDQETPGGENQGPEGGTDQETPDEEDKEPEEDDSGNSGSTKPDAFTWTITVEPSEGGQVFSSVSKAKKGSLVTLTTEPQEGYHLESLTVTTADGKEVDLTDRGNGEYRFTMPSAKVTVTAVFTREIEEIALPFADVAADAWYREAVEFVYAQGMMTGTDADHFSPEVTTSRGMIVTILYRLEGSPVSSGSAGFSDVAGGQWYADAVRWASQRGIVNGYGDGRFGPNDPITREQMAAIFYRYAQYKHCDVSGRADLTGFVDQSAVGLYAQTAMEWAVAEGLITGTTPVTLSPAGSATRAQAATILMRLCSWMAA